VQLHFLGILGVPDFTEKGVIYLPNKIKAINIDYQYSYNKILSNKILEKNK